MVNYVGVIDNNVNLYEDPFMEDDKVLKGRKQGSDKKTFIVANPKTSNMLYEQYKKRLRKQKLERICND